MEISTAASTATATAGTASPRVQAHGTRPPGSVVAAALLTGGPILMLVSVPIDPPPIGPDPLGTIIAYTESPGRMDLAATVPHNGFLLFGLGLFAAGMLIRDRGRGLAVTGGLLGGIGLADLSGAVFWDWSQSAVGRVACLQTALRVEDAFALPALVAGWLVPMAVFSLLGPVLLLAGVVRGGLLPWWSAAAAAVVSIGLIVVGIPGPVGSALVFGAQTVVGACLAVAVTRSDPPVPTAAGDVRRPATAEGL